jgi:hypothetical protein
VKNFNELRKKSKSRVVVARTYRREINRLEKQQLALYAQALKSLEVSDTSSVFDYFFNTPNEGYSSFEKTLEEK